MQRESEELKKYRGDFEINDVLKEISEFLEEHFELPEGANTLIVLWVLASYEIDHYEKFPLLHIFSPTKSCGKTTLLQLIGFFTKRSHMVGDISPAAMNYIIDRNKPTLLFDEVDEFIGKINDAFTKLLNLGYQKSNSQVTRMDDDNAGVITKSLFCPKVTAGIGLGNLTPALRSRGLLISLGKNKTKNRKDIKPVLDEMDNNPKIRMIRRKLDTWTKANKKEIKRVLKQSNDNPGELVRNRDNWLPLDTVSACVGGNWYTELGEARSIYEEANLTVDDDTQLFRDIRSIFKDNEKELVKQKSIKYAKLEARKWNRLTPTTLTERLLVIPASPYKTNKLVAYKLRNQLKNFSINFKKQRVTKGKGNPVNCYSYDDIKEIIKRYC